MEIKMNLNETRIARDAAEKAYRKARLSAAKAIITELKKTGKEITSKEIANAVGCRPCDIYTIIRPDKNDKVKTGVKVSIKKFAEIDESGKVIPDGDTRTIRTIETTYCYNN